MNNKERALQEATDELRKTAQLFSKARTRKEEEGIEKELFNARKRFAAASVACLPEVKAALGRRWTSLPGNTYDLESAYEQVFYDALLETAKVIEQKLTKEYRVSVKWYIFITNLRFNDLYRKEKKRFDFSLEKQKEETLSTDQNIETMLIDIEHLTEAKNKFRSLLNREEQVFLRWFWCKKPGDDVIAKVYGYAPGYVRVRRNRLMNRLANNRLHPYQADENVLNSTYPDTANPSENDIKAVKVKVTGYGKSPISAEPFVAVVPKIEERVLLLWYWNYPDQIDAIAEVFEYSSLEHLRCNIAYLHKLLINGLDKDPLSLQKEVS